MYINVRKLFAITWYFSDHLPVYRIGSFEWTTCVAREKYNMYGDCCLVIIVYVLFASIVNTDY